MVIHKNNKKMFVVKTQHYQTTTVQFAVFLECMKACAGQFIWCKTSTTNCFFLLSLLLFTIFYLATDTRNQHTGSQNKINCDCEARKFAVESTLTGSKKWSIDPSDCSHQWKVSCITEKPQHQTILIETSVWYTMPDMGVEGTCPPPMF